MSEWKPIATAPKDRPILACGIKWIGVPMMVEWDYALRAWFVYGEGHGINPQPTHWFNYPEPPNDQG